jgi:uncharacterized membrane protein HdeD (DUF308 family)
LIETLNKNRLLLGLVGVLQMMMAVIYFVMEDAAGPITLHAWNSTVSLLGLIAIAAGVLTVAAGIWRSAQGKCWLLVLNGLALSALGVIYYGFTRSPISLLSIACLIIVMALSLAALELVTARALRRSKWLLTLAAVASGGFGFVFLALGLGWIRLELGSRLDFLCFGAYFGFSAICMLTLALLVGGQSLSQSGRRPSLSPLENPRPAH